MKTFLHYSTLALLHEVDHRILKQAPLDLTLQYLCDQLVLLFDYDLVWIALKQPDGSTGVGAAAGPCVGFLEQGGQLGPTGEALRTGEPQRGKWDGPAELVWLEGMAASGLREALALPLAAPAQTIGALSLYSSRDGAFDEESTVCLTGLADQVALSLQTARDQVQLRLQTEALEAAANAVMITDRAGRIVWVNQAWSRMTGYGLAEVEGQPPSLLKSGYHEDAFYRELWEMISTGQAWRGELHNRRKDGSVYVDESTITPVKGQDGEVTHFIAINQDITDRKRHEAQLHHLATHDPLTDLPNRRALTEHLAQVVEESREGRPGALVLVDVDNFKVVNDTAGHAGGDDLLVSLTQLLLRACRPGDLVARLGGDEFALLVGDLPPEEVRSLAERLRQSVRDFRFSHGGRSYDLSISVGIALIDGTLDPGALMVLADTALYVAKEEGKNRVVIFRSEHEKGVELATSGQWAGRVRDALREERLVLHFQPIVRIDSGQVDHYEALLRMREQGGALVMPGAFLAAAERFGLMPEIDLWVVGHLLPQLQADPNLRIFANLSGQSLGDAELLAHLEEIIRSSGIKPGQLTFEITETTAVRDLDLADQWMRRLKELGCSFALDDFGIGFSSFSYLRSLPADFVKIDGSFILDLDRDPTNRSLVQAIKTVAHTLGKQVIAEWVESQSVADVLAELGVEHGQGFRWGRPEPRPQTA